MKLKSRMIVGLEVEATDITGNIRRQRSVLGLDDAAKQGCAVEGLRPTFPQHPFQRPRVGQAVIVADFNQRRRGQAAVGDQFLAVGKGDHIVCPGVQDHCAGFYSCGGPPVLPSRAEQNEPGAAAVDIDGHGPAPGRPDHGGGLVGIELALGDADRFGKVVVGQLGVQDHMTMAGQVCGLQPAGDAVPTVKE